MAAAIYRCIAGVGWDKNFDSKRLCQFIHRRPLAILGLLLRLYGKSALARRFRCLEDHMAKPLVETAIPVPVP